MTDEVTAQEIRSGNKEGNLYISAAEYVRMQDEITSYRKTLNKLKTFIEAKLYGTPWIED